MKKSIVFGAVGVSALIAVSFVGAMIMGLSYTELKREFREALGLPKFWVTKFNDDPARYSRLECPKDRPIVIVTGGQSNAANSYGVVSPPGNDRQTFMFFSGHCYKLQSPVLGATGAGDSLWPKLGEALNQTTGRPVVFINGAVGGVQIGDWVDARSGYFARLSEQVQQARKLGYVPDMVLWIQGETDSSTMIDPQRYVRHQRQVIEMFRAAGATAAGTPWFLYRSTRCLHRQNNGPAIDRAIAEYAGKAGDAVFVGPHVSLYDDSFRHDMCHLNAQGRDRLVKDTMAILAAANLLPPKAQAPAM